MNEAFESVKHALIGVTQDTGCKPETVKLITEAVTQWEKVESETCAELRRQLAMIAASNANEIATLRSQLQEAKRINGELSGRLEEKRVKYALIDADVRQAIRATGLCEIEGSTVGLVESICDLAKQRCEDMDKLREARRKEIRITFDRIEGSFHVTFGRTGQVVRFEKARSVAGNVENWLANLRHAED